MLQYMKGSIMLSSIQVHAREREMLETIKLRKGVQYAQMVQYAAISLAIAEVALAASRMPQPLAEKLVKEHREAVLCSLGLAYSDPKNPEFTEKEAALINDVHTIFEARMDTFNQIFSALPRG